MWLISEQSDKLCEESDTRHSTAHRRCIQKSFPEDMLLVGTEEPWGARPGHLNLTAIDICGLIILCGGGGLSCDM